MGLLTNSILGTSAKAGTGAIATTARGITGGLMETSVLPKAARNISGGAFEHGEGSMFLGVTGKASSNNMSLKLSNTSNLVTTNPNTLMANAGFKGASDDLVGLSNEMSKMGTSIKNIQALSAQSMQIMEGSLRDLLQQLSDGTDDSTRENKAYRDSFFKLVQNIEREVNKMFSFINSLSK